MPLFGLFGLPNVEKLKAKGDVQGLIKALNYKKDAQIDQQKASSEAKAKHKECAAVRQAAAEALGQIRDARAVESLVAALIDKDWGVRKAAIKALVKIGTPSVTPLEEALKNKESQVRKEAAEALGQIGDPQAVEPLVAALMDKNWDVRKAAIKALVRIGDALGQIGDARAMGPLKEALEYEYGEVSEVKQAAAAALVRIGPAAVELLITVLKERSEWYAARALGQIGDARAVEPLVATVVNAKNLTELTTPAPVEEPILALEKVLERVTAEVTTEELRKIVTLGDSIHVSSPAGACMSWFKTIDCSRVKQLARQELIRRGLEA